ncbi:hypothetical protein [Sphingosinicella sp.]|uniref:hypothetical protein n=1 Tax=Sphingosinicella sp. TaxID=1917971 RepID=UPI004037E0A4
MSRDLERVLVETEDFLMRQIGSNAARQAHMRRVRRGFGEAFGRGRRAAIIFIGLIFSLIIASIAGASVGFFTWLIALPAFFLAALVSLSFPTRGSRRREPAISHEEALQRMPLATLADRCGEYLADRASDLPRAALPAADQILARLSQLQPHLANLRANEPIAGEARRLIGGHLPRLVDSWLALPPGERGAASENSRRISESLDIVADELAEICRNLDACRNSSFVVEHRFIETRYRDGELDRE